MKKYAMVLSGFMMILASCAPNPNEDNAATVESETDAAVEADILPEVPEGAQAISLTGEAFYAASPSEGDIGKYEKAKADYEADPGNADNLIWLGRWNAHTGDFREAIRVYTKGIEQFPKDARFLRHRGHRYISIREFDRAIADFEKAASLIEGTEDIVEPDGRPNAQNTPVSSLHSNIWYHLGLAYYLNNDMENAHRVYRIAVETSTNDDKLVSTTHWYYMILRRLGRNDDAATALEPIKAEMNIIENMAYHQLCLFYKGEITLEQLTGPDFADIMNDAVAYGIANWHSYNGEREKAKEALERILEGNAWASFGYIAAEADHVRGFGEQ